MKTYRDLIVWQKAMTLVAETYKETVTFPKEELYSLTSQIRRSSISIPSNISGGYGRQRQRGFIHFLRISRGSLYELQVQIEIANILHFMDHISIENIIIKCQEIEKMLTRLIYVLTKKLNENNSNSK